MMMVERSRRSPLSRTVVVEKDQIWKTVWQQKLKELAFEKTVSIVLFPVTPGSSTSEMLKLMVLECLLINCVIYCIFQRKFSLFNLFRDVDQNSAIDTYHIMIFNCKITYK